MTTNLDFQDPFEASAAGPKLDFADPFESAQGAQPSAKTPDPNVDHGFFGGLKRGFLANVPQIEGLTGAALAAGGAAVGADSVRDYGLDLYRRKNAEAAPLEGPSFADVRADFTRAPEYIGNVLGNFGGQAVLSGAAAAAGATAGGGATAETGPGAGIGAVLGAIGGVVARKELTHILEKKAAELVAEQVAKGVTKDVAEQAGKKFVVDELAGAATQRTLRKAGGAVTGAFVPNAVQEIGTSFGSRADDLQAQGKSDAQLTGGDATRAIGAGLVSGAVDTAAEVLNIGRIFRGASANPGIVKRVLAGVAKGSLTEGGTEATQAVLERLGASQALTGPEALNDYLENFMAGAVGGAFIGAPSGVHQKAAELGFKDGQQQKVMDRLRLPPPSTITVDSAGNAVRGQGNPNPEVTGDVSLRHPQGRGMSMVAPGPQTRQTVTIDGATGQVVAHALPDPANGVLSRVVNLAVETGAVPSTAPHSAAVALPQESAHVTAPTGEAGSAVVEPVGQLHPTEVGAADVSHQASEPTGGEAVATALSELSSGPSEAVQSAPTTSQSQSPESQKSPAAAAPSLELAAGASPDEPTHPQPATPEVPSAPIATKDQTANAAETGQNISSASEIPSGAPVAPLESAPTPSSTPAPQSQESNKKQPPSVGQVSHVQPTPAGKAAQAQAKEASVRDQMQAMIGAGQRVDTQAITKATGVPQSRVESLHREANIAARKATQERMATPAEAPAPIETLKNDKAFRGVLKALNDPHVDSGVAAQVAEGYADAKAGRAPNDRHYTPVDSLARGHNPIDAYISGFAAGAGEKPRAIHARESAPVWLKHSEARANAATPAAPPQTITRPGSTSSKDEGFKSIASVEQAIKSAGQRVSDYTIERRNSGLVAVRKAEASAPTQEKSHGHEVSARQENGQSQAGAQSEQGARESAQQGAVPTELPAGDHAGVPAATAAAEKGAGRVLTQAAKPFFDDLRTLIGWSQIGGRIVRGGAVETNQEAGASFGRTGGDVIGRTAWIGKLDANGRESLFWRHRPDASLNEASATKAMDKFDKGLPLGPREQRFIEYAVRMAEADHAEFEQVNAEHRAEQAQRELTVMAKADPGVLAAITDLPLGDEAAAAELANLTQQAYDMGASHDQVLDILFDGAPDEQVSALTTLIHSLEATRGTESGTEAANRESGVRGERQGNQAVPEKGSGQAGFFGNPTAQEVLAAEAARRDAARNGQTGTGRSDMISGAGELFAGARPAQADIENPIIAAANEAATSPLNDLPPPTAAQKEAGNYQKGHVAFNGLDISIENPAGSKRRPEWPPLKYAYGYIKRTMGADGDHVDAFLSPEAINPDLPVFVIDQNNRDGSFDEHKVMMGFADEAAARKGYLDNYTKGWNGLGAITSMSLDEFKAWLKTEDTTKPVAARPEKINDLGEKIGGARKDVSGGRTEKKAEPPRFEAAPTRDGKRWTVKDAVTGKVQQEGFHAKLFDSETAANQFAKTLNEARAEAKASDSTWRKRYAVVDNTSLIERAPWAVRDLRTGKMVRSSESQSKAEAEAKIPLLVVAMNHRVYSTSATDTAPAGFEIWRNVTDRKRVKVVDQIFPTRDDAMQYMAKHAVDIIETKTRFGEEILPRPETVHREGPLRRVGDVKGDDFMSAFGFRGVEFGNWNNQVERQEVMNHAYDGLMDLSDVLGIPPKAISLNGDLALAFGARGQGLTGARAHYETDKGVINLTKMSGAGALAHEWFHALDHYFGRLDGKAVQAKKEADGTTTFGKAGAAAMLSHGPQFNSKMRAELATSYKDLLQTMFTKAEQYVEDTANAQKFAGHTQEQLATALQKLRDYIAKPRDWGAKKNPASPAQLAEFDVLAETLLGSPQVFELRNVAPGNTPARKRGAFNMRMTNDTLEKMGTILKAVTGRGGFNKDSSDWLDQVRGYARRHAERLAMLASAEKSEVKTTRVPTSFAMNAKRIDQGSATDYWTTPHEMAARAFSAYVEDKIEAKGGNSEFLSFGSDNNQPIFRFLGIRPFPEGAERETLDKAFEHFFQTVKTETVDNGNVRLYSQPRNTTLDRFFGERHQSQIQSYVDVLTATWDKATAPKVVVVQDFSELPAEARADTAARTAEGFYDDATGTVYLVASQLQDFKRVKQVLAHETIGHYGIESITTPQEWKGITDTLATMEVNPKHAALFDELRRRYPNADQNTFAKEAVAVMAEKGVKNSIIDRVIVAIRRLLRALGLDVPMGERELRQQIAAAARYVKTGQGETVAKPEPVDRALQQAFSDLKNGKRSAPANIENPAHEGLPLFSRLAQAIGRPLSAFFKGLGKLDGVFQYPVSQKTDLADVLHDFAQRSPMEIVHQQNLRADFGKGESAIPATSYAIQLGPDQANTAIVYVEKGGDGRMYLDASSLTAGKSGGTALYMALFNYAANAGKIFIGDPHGLSDEALIRRTEVMAAAAMKYGGTWFMRPHPRQLAPGFKWASPLNWKDGDAEGNLESLLQTAYNNVRTFAPGIADVTYDFQRNEFLDAGGKPVTRDGLERIASGARKAFAARVGTDANLDHSGEAAFGWSTVARGILAHTVLRRSGDARADVVDGAQGLTRSPDGGVPEALKRVLYSQPDPAAGESRGIFANRLTYLDKIGTRAPQSIPARFDQAQRIAAEKFATFKPSESFKDRWTRIKNNAADRIAQKVVDQFRPLKTLNIDAFMQAHLSKGTDGALEAVFEHGVPVMHEGAFAVHERSGGFQKVLSNLKGEHDQFLMWVVGNRAEALLGDKRERLFTEEDVAAMKRLNLGQMTDGKSRPQAYGQALKEMQRYNKAFLDIAQEAGLINVEGRKVWEDGFYIPFYREMEDNPNVSVGQIKGLVQQRVIERLVGGSEPMGDPLQNILANWSHMLTASMKNTAANTALKTAVQLEIAEHAKGPEKGVVWTMRDGIEKYWKVHDPMVLEALEALSFNGYDNPVMRAAAKFKRALTATVTINPAFRIRNMARDVLTSMATADVGYNPVKNIVNGLKATARHTDTNINLMAGGGAVRFGAINDGDQASHAKRLIAMGIQDNQILDTADKVKNAFRRAYDWWAEVGDRTETINRALIYDKLIAQGKSHLEASFEARDLMNFTSAGSAASVRALIQVLPFFNARIQGVDRLIRGAKADPRRFLAVTGTLALASAGLFLANKDDDDYKNLPDFVRDNYWPIKLAGKWLYIPKPFEVGAMASIVERGTELAVAGNDYEAQDFAGTVFGLISSQLSMNPIPQIVRPITETAFNYDLFRMAPIDTMGQQNLAPQDRYTASTSAGAIAAGRVVGISPQRMEHLVTGYLGWVGVQALNVSDYLLRDAMDLPSNPRRDITRAGNLFVLGDFVKEPGLGAGKYVTRFYAAQAEIDELYASANLARKTGNQERLVDLLANPKLRERRLYARGDKEISRVNQQIKIVSNSHTLTAAEKNDRIEALNRLRNSIAERVDQAARQDEARQRQLL